MCASRSKALPIAAYSLPVSVDPDAALAAADDLGDLAGRDVPFGDGTGEVADDLTVDLLEQVVAQQVAEARVLDGAGVVQVACRALRKGFQCLLAAPIVAQAGKVELDVPQAAGTVGFEPDDGLPEHPEHEVGNARARRRVTIDRADAVPVELVKVIVGQRAVPGVGTARVLDEQGAGDLQQAVLALTKQHRAHLGAQLVGIIVNVEQCLKALHALGRPEELLVRLYDLIDAVAAMRPSSGRTSEVRSAVNTP